MKVDYPGLIKEPLPSGNFRYRVRVEGNKRKRIRLHVTPEHPDFAEHYHRARAGVELSAAPHPPELEAPETVGWLTREYEKHMTQQVAAGRMSPATLKQRASFFSRYRTSYGGHSMHMPRSAVLALRDSMAATPGAADNMVKAIRALYVWAVDRDICALNPAKGVEKINPGSGGASAWTTKDLKRYRDAHGTGTMAHRTLTLFMFSACRISDAVWLGTDQQERDGDVTWLSWQPVKRGSMPVDIPMLPPLIDAVDGCEGEFIRSESGKPFASTEGLRNRFKKWCVDAELGHLSAHGIRKAAGNLLSEHGASQYQIMAIHGHSSARTSEVYTRTAKRRVLARDAMESIKGISW